VARRAVSVATQAVPAEDLSDGHCGIAPALNYLVLSPATSMGQVEWPHGAVGAARMKGSVAKSQQVQGTEVPCSVSQELEGEVGHT